MFKNYLKTAWRNLKNNKVYAAINIVGLATGLAVCMTIILYVEHESGYDTFHANAGRIYWMQGKVKMGNESIFMPKMSFASAPLARQHDASVESFMRLMSSYKAPVIQSSASAGKKFAEKDFLFADSNFFNFFSFKLLQGNNKQVLQKPFTVVISREAAQKYFGKEDPVGKTITYNDQYIFTITGVAANTPSNSSIRYDFVASVQSLAGIDDYKKLLESQQVQLGSFSTYFLLRNATDAPHLEATLVQLANNANKEDGNNESYMATPLTSTHLHANYGDSANIKYLRVFPFVALLILLLALTNYVSLSTARSASRAKEIGVRKVLGASKKSIAMQFFSESTVYAVISFLLAAMLCINFQPLFFNFLHINIDAAFFYNPYLLLSFAALFVVTVVLAAAYPSILLSAFKPARVLYGKFSRQSGGLTVRKFFTVFQFFISVALIICAIVIDRQMYFFRHADTGVNRENIVMIPFEPSIGKHFAAFRQETASLAGVQQTTAAHYPMYKGYDIFFTKGKGANTDVTLPVFSVDENFIPMLGLQWKIKPDAPLDYNKNQVVINEETISKLNLEHNNPLHEKISVGSGEYEVAGVLKNFNYQSLHEKIGALCLFIASDTASGWAQAGGCLFVKAKVHVNMPALIQQIKSVYEKYDRQKPFEFTFMDDNYEAMYTAEDRLSKIFETFTVLTICIACLGLFGLITFMAEQRTKEIGIRKVLGASVQSIVQMLSKDFIKLILIAFIVAVPVAWWAMHSWLEDFAYRISVEWWMIAAAGGGVLLIALLTISFQAIKAAMANPVKSLRTE
ncbi:ABC transporter permease [Parafilimonas sp.]|uniref:ABC transporter permease n=1 Tax=Parafilimonas sp. TaxID=1969739 RepID=UPI0039E39DC3